MDTCENDADIMKGHLIEFLYPKAPDAMAGSAAPQPPGPDPSICHNDSAEAESSSGMGPSMSSSF
jgi:hypothetical protein